MGMLSTHLFQLFCFGPLVKRAKVKGELRLGLTLNNSSKTLTTSLAPASP